MTVLIDQGAEPQARTSRLFAGRSERIALGMVMLSIALLVFCGRVSYAESDARFDLVVSQALLEHHTIKLDAYVAARPDLAHHYQIRRINGHFYDYFPIGTSLYALPAVWMARWAGYDMLIPTDAAAIQHLLATLTCMAIAGLSYVICRAYVGRLASTLIAISMIAGSSLVSTLGTALWSANFSLLFTLLSLLILTRFHAGRPSAGGAYLLGLTLFSSYLCRPTAAPLALFSLILLASFDWRAAVRCAGVLILLSGAFVALAWMEYGAPLPPYYQPGRIGAAQTHSLPRILYGLTFSPSRGLFTFSPHLLVGALALGLGWRLRGHRFWWCMWAWIIAHLAVIARFDPWWGGFGYGPRLLADTLPAWMLVLAFAWQARDQARPLLHRVGAWAYLGAAGVAIWINAHNGLYNPATLAWNSLPMSVDGTPGRMFDWRAPQFAATRESLCANGMAIAQALTEPAAPGLAVVRAGQRIVIADASAQPTRVRMINWWLPEGPIVWSGCATAAVIFGPAFANDIVRADALTLSFATSREQTVQIALNDVVLGRVSAAAGESTYEIPVDARLWRSPGNNRLEFSTDLAATHNPADPRSVGVALRWIAFRPPAAP